MGIVQRERNKALSTIIRMKMKRKVVSKDRRYP